MGLRSSETFGVESGYGKEFITWVNEYAKKRELKIEARLYNYIIKTENFGSFEMFSWIGQARTARKVALVASRQFKIKIIEGGYRPKEKTISTRKTDYAMVKKGNRTLGRLKFSMSLLGNGMWQLDEEQRE